MDLWVCGCTLSLYPFSSTRLYRPCPAVLPWTSGVMDVALVCRSFGSTWDAIASGCVSDRCPQIFRPKFHPAYGGVSFCWVLLILPITYFKSPKCPPTLSLLLNGATLFDLPSLLVLSSSLALPPPLPSASQSPAWHSVTDCLPLPWASRPRSHPWACQSIGSTLDLRSFDPSAI